MLTRHYIDQRSYSSLVGSRARVLLSCTSQAVLVMIEIYFTWISKALWGILEEKSKGKNHREENRGGSGQFLVLLFLRLF